MPDDADPSAGDFPIDGEILLVAAATASVAPQRLPDLLRAVQTDLAPRLDEYRRRFERVAGDDERDVFLVPTDHWDAVGARLDFDRRERDAVRRAHNRQCLRLGGSLDRREEFETALDIRDAVVVGATPRD